MKSLLIAIILLAAFSNEAQTIDDKQTLRKLNEDAISSYKNQKFDDAIKLARQAVELSIKIYGAEHRETAVAHSNLGVLYRDKKKFKESIESLQKSIEIYEKNPAAQDDALVETYEALAFSQTLNDDKEAANSYLKAIAIAESKFGSDGKQLFSPTLNLANLYARNKEYDKADEFYLKSYALALKHFGRESERLTRIEDSRSCLTGMNVNVERNKIFNEERLKLLGGTVAKTDSGVINTGIVNGKALSLPKPPYPAEARSQRASGTVSVRVWIDEKGNVTEVKAICGHPALVKSTEEVARGAKFAPTTLNGVPVKTVGVLVYNFVF